MSARRPLKIGMIGVGDIALLHHRGYQGFADGVVAALCDRDEDRLAERARDWGVPYTTTDYRDLLADPDIDLVEVNTPHHLHKPITVEALAAGKHVSCQKPIATTVRDAEAMVRAAGESTGTFRVFENFVFYPPYVLAKQLLDAGEIGELLTIRFKLGTGLFGSRWIPLKTELWHLTESERGMGQAVFDDGYHKLSMAIHLVGGIDVVQGFIDRSFRYIDAPAQLMWRYKDRATLGSFDIAFSPSLYTHSPYFPADERIDIVGTRGLMSLSRCTGRIADDPPLVVYRDGKRVLYEDLDTDWQASFTAGVRDFPTALLEGRESLISGQRALDILRFAYACILAARLGTEVRPDEVTDEWVEAVVKGGAA